MCTRQPQKVLRDMINTLFLTTVAVEPTLVAFHLHLRTYFRGLSCHSFKFLWRTGQTKPPTIPFGIVACPFSDNLSRNSCILCPVCLAPPFSKYAIPSSPYLFSTHASLQNPLVPVLLQNKTISYSSSFLKTQKATMTSRVYSLNVLKLNLVSSFSQTAGTFPLYSLKYEQKRRMNA